MISRAKWLGAKFHPSTAVKGLMKALWLENQLCIVVPLCYPRCRSSYSCGKVVFFLPALKCIPNDHGSFTSSRHLDTVRKWRNVLKRLFPLPSPPPHPHPRDLFISPASENNYKLPRSHLWNQAFMWCPLLYCFNPTGWLFQYSAKKIFLSYFCVIRLSGKGHLHDRTMFWVQFAKVGAQYLTYGYLYKFVLSKVEA